MHEEIRIFKSTKYHLLQIFIFLVLTILTCLNVVHELGHLLSAYLVDAEVEDIKLYPRACVVYRDLNNKQLKLILPSGSLLNVLYGIILVAIGKKKNYYGLFMAGSLIIEAELGYWNLFMPLSKHEDAVMFYNLFPNISIYNKYFSFLISIVQIFFFMFSAKSIYDIMMSSDYNIEREFRIIVDRTIKKYNLY